MRLQSILLQVILLMVTFVFSGCFASHPKNIIAFTKPRSVDVTSDNYVLEPPDEVQIFCIDVPELDKIRQRIRPDGMIGFEKIGEVVAAGKTPEQLAAILKQKISEYYTFTEENPVNVQVAAFQSKLYYVVGQVSDPGPKIYTGRDTVLTAITRANPTPLAWIHRIQVVRPSSDKSIKPKIFEVDLDKLTAYGDTSKNVLLNEGDVIFVPPTFLAWLGMKIEEFIRPVARAFSGYYMVNRGISNSGSYGGGY